MKQDPATMRQVAAQLHVGVVLKLFSPIAEKYKRQIMIYAGSDRSLAFMINTHLAPMIIRDAERSPRHIPMTVSVSPAPY